MANSVTDFLKALKGGLSGPSTREAQRSRSAATMAERTRVLQGGVPAAAEKGLTMTPGNVVRSAGRGLGRFAKGGMGFLVAPTIGQAVGERIGAAMSTPEAIGNTQAIGADRGALNSLSVMQSSVPQGQQEVPPPNPPEPMQAPYAASQSFDEDTMQQIVDFINRNQVQSPAWQGANQIANEAYTPAQGVEFTPYQASQNRNPLVRFASRLGDTLTGGQARHNQRQMEQIQGVGMANQVNQQGNFQEPDRMRMQAYLQQATGTDLGNASMAQAVPGQQAQLEGSQRAIAGSLAGQSMQQPVGPELMQQLLQAAGIDAATIDPQTYQQLLEYFMLKANPLAGYGAMLQGSPMDNIPINR